MVDLNKPLLYKGKPVRLICTDRVTIVGESLVILESKQNYDGNKYESPRTIRPDDPNLTNVVEEVSTFFNVYQNDDEVRLGLGWLSLFFLRQNRSSPVNTIVHILEIVLNKNTGEFIRTVVHPVTE